ncbi:cytochrome c oxidase accessory protein CcoG [Hyphomonadaceae bacterium BL14]|nr:cytochrome c oxidase accessory protein CcoG [Hyphomonadaceae bacterium BL14]
MNLIHNRPDAGGDAAEGVARNDVEAVNAAGQRDLYQKRQQIYPKLVHGKFRMAKWVFLVLALGVYYLLPFVRWDRGPDAPSQAVLIDFPNTRFYFFFIEIWPQEVYYITGLLILAALVLFLVTALFGRVWCGYACPQTVWTDLFIAVERLFEGDRNKRILLDRAPMSFNKAWRKGGKHAVWVLIAAATGGAWILYFHDAFDLLRDFFTGQAPLTAYLFCAVLTFTTYSLAGLMREQVCIYMCPWPRIQAALTDRESLNVTYRTDRGEPRGRHKKGESWEGRGDCIDCKACVAACPMGIDIRDGAQLECIGCALCIDACDDIMDKISRPRGLIAYDTDDNVTRRSQGEKPRFSFIRPRIILYVVLVIGVSALMMLGLNTRDELGLHADRDRNPNFVVLTDGSVRNTYTINVQNKAYADRALRLDVAGDPALQVQVLGVRGETVLEIGPDRTRLFQVFLTVPPEAALRHSIPVTFTITDPATGETATAESFLVTGAAP